MNNQTDYLNFDLLITRASDQHRAYVVDTPDGVADRSGGV